MCKSGPFSQRLQRHPSPQDRSKRHPSRSPTRDEVDGRVTRAKSKPWSFRQHTSGIAAFNLRLGQSVDIGRSVKVIETLKIMKERGVRPDILTYNSAMELFAKRAMEDEAWALVDDMKALGILPDIETYKFLLKVRMENHYIYRTVADTVSSTHRLFARHLTRLLGPCSK